MPLRIIETVKILYGFIELLNPRRALKKLLLKLLKISLESCQISIFLFFNHSLFIKIILSPYNLTRKIGRYEVIIMIPVFKLFPPILHKILEGVKLVRYVSL